MSGSCIRQHLRKTAWHYGTCTDGTVSDHYPDTKQKDNTAKSCGIRGHHIGPSAVAVQGRQAKQIHASC